MITTNRCIVMHCVLERTQTKVDGAMWYLRGGVGRGAFVVLYVGLVVTPLLLARLVIGYEIGFREGLASGLGMAAFAMLLIGFWLNGRFRAISARGGLDLILTFHRYASVGAVALLVAHVVAVQSSGLDAPSAAAWVAFVVVLVIMVMALGRSRMKLRFETWRYSHGIGAIVVALAGVAHATSDGVYSSASPLSVFWIVMVVAAVGSLVWVHAVRPASKARHPYNVVSVIRAADRTWTVALEPRDGEAMEFIAGKYAFVSFGERGYRRFGNPFTFSSSPAQRPRIEFTIKENGDFTDTISEVAPGTVAYLDGPFGHLSPGNYRGPKQEIERVVMVAGGVGITPMISILRQGADRHQPQPMKLLYGARTADEMAFLDEIEQLQGDLNLEVHYTVSDPPEGWTHDVGHLDDAFLNCHLDESDKGSMFFVCGSTGLVDTVLTNLDEHDLATPGLVHSENFSIYD